MQQNQRLKYIDCIKGVMILFVIYYHVLWACVRFKDSPTVEIFDLVCMQSFFFVSGFLSFKRIEVFKMSDYYFLIKKKIVNVFVPTMSMFLFFSLYFNHNIPSFLFEEFKGGYWFTYVLFIIFSFHYLFLFLQKVIRIDERITDGLMMLGGALLFCFYSRIYHYQDCKILHFLSTMFVMKYYIFFLMGYMLNKYEQFTKHIHPRGVFLTILLILSFIPFYTDNIRGPFNIIELLVSMSQVMLVFILFSRYSFFNGQSAINKQLSFLGRHSMEIYFIHYFFFFSMPYALDIILQSQTTCLRNAPGAYFIPEILCVLPVAIAMAYISIGVRKVVDISPVLSKLFFGPLHN